MFNLVKKRGEIYFKFASIALCSGFLCFNLLQCYLCLIHEKYFVLKFIWFLIGGEIYSMFKHRNFLFTVGCHTAVFYYCSLLFSSTFISQQACVAQFFLFCKIFN